MLDVDHFKQVNDAHGHAAGDAVLRGLARRVTDGLRQVDLLGRYGGKELLLVMPGLPCDDPPTAIEQLCAAVASEPFDLGGGGPPLAVTISIGVAWFGVGRGGEPAPHDDAQRLFGRAGAALYEAKRGGRHRVVCTSPAAEAGPTTAPTSASSTSTTTSAGVRTSARAGVKLLSGLSNAALLRALRVVPTIKTGRPKIKRPE